MNCMKITKQLEIKTGRGFLKEKTFLSFLISISLSFVCIFFNLLMLVHTEKPDNN